MESSLRNEPEVDGEQCRRGKPGKGRTPAYSEHLACSGTTRCDSGHRNTRSAAKSGGVVVQSSTVGLAVAGQSDMTQKRTLSGWAKDRPAGAVEGHMHPVDVDVRQAGVVARMRHTTLEELARLHARQCAQAQMLESELKLE